VAMPPYGAYRFTRIAGPTPDAPDVYAPIQEGWISPHRFQNTGRPIWKALDGTVYAKGTAYGEEIRAFPAKNDPAVLVLDREFETQSVDPMFLEPECGLAWYNTDRKILELVLGVQSPYEAATAIAFLLGKAREPFKPSAVNAQFAYVGGGFGGRDHTPLPLYVALAGDVFSPGRPVRLAHNRYQRSRAASSGTRSKFAPRSASTGPAARCWPLLPTMSSTAAASPIIRPAWRTSPPLPRSASMKSRRLM
jgi:Molybdopterin-binding domain of aldehyde dehydrogenase